MKRSTLSVIAVLSLANAFSATLSADDSFTLFSNAKFNGEVRTRYENVDVQNSTKKDANAYTVRATIGLEANLFGLDALSMKVDGTTVQALGDQSYNSTTNGMTGYQVVKDPEQTRFSQAYLQYKLNKTVAKVGRQIVNLDNERFIGSVDWRQMMQSFDAAVIRDTSIENLTLTGGYIWGIDGISNIPSTKTDSIIMNGSYTFTDVLKVTAYDYMLSSLHDTLGLALTGDVPVAGAKIAYRGEYATQGDASRDTSGVVITPTTGKANAYYYNLDALANISGVLVGAGYEVLSGSNGIDGKTAFSTPLATLHKFNGWADMFLVTPLGGLCDASATLGYTDPALGKAMVVYHDFTTDLAMAGKSDLGKEWDMLYSNNIPGVKGLNGLLKAAYYKAGDVSGFTANTSKIWLQLDYKF